MHHPDSAGVSSNGNMAHQRIYPASVSNTGSDGGALLSTPPNTVVNNVQIPVDECLLTQSSSVLSSQASQQPPHNLSLHSLSSQSAGAQMKKKSGFQITSVTSAQVSVGTNNSIAEDTESYDDLDESHTEDMSSSEILDVSLSRANDLAGAERSSSEETLNNFHEAESPGAISPNQLSHLHLMNQSGTIVNGTMHHHYLHHHVTLRHPPQSPSPSASPSSNIGVILENTSSGNISSGGDVTSASVARMHSSVTGTTTGVINHQSSNAGYVNVPSPNVFVRDNKSGSGNISNIEGVTGRVAIGANINETIQQDQTMNSTIISTTFENANAVIGLPNGNLGGSITQSSAAVTVVTVASVSLTQQQPLPTSAPTTTTASSRFRVVKLDSSSEPFKKGRWTCADYHDKDAPASAPSFSTPDVTALGMRAGESVQQNYSECFNSGVGRESTIGSSCTVSSTVSTQNCYTDTVGGGKVGRVQHSQDYVTSLQGFQTSLFNGLNMGVSQTETLIHKDLIQTTGPPSAQTGILQSVSMTGVQNPTGNPIFAVSQQQLSYAQAVANQSPGSNKGPLKVHQPPSVTAQYGQSHQSIPQPADSQPLAPNPSGPGNGNMVGGQHEQPMISMPAQMRLQQTTSLQVNTFSVVPQMGVGGPDQQGTSNPIMLDRQQQQPLTTQGLLTLLPSASQVPSPANLKNYPLSMSQMHNGVNSGRALYASLPTFTTTQLEDAQRLLLQHQSALLGLPKLAEASSPASAAFGQAGDSSALTSTVFLKAIDGEDGLSGASVVAIDNKIEQAMDLVKSHLMFAVREEVEVLKEQIKDLIDRNTQLEQENTLLKTLASPEQIAQLHSQVQTGSPPVSVATTGPQNLAATTQPVSHNSFSSA
ncbi:TSC22 domain family protein 1-like [Gadus macrocephalus]|uniref:TSC22 domain family protein 1-like n=1 Tax=Gadus macrocephalus TaxID=80720 RepID=UPI0028CB4806|nr:TSC22 domain family protein 1-like [Gadus macrocephalus]